MKATQTVWQEIEALLKEKRNKIYDEIISYPPPIPACDVQFNHLIAQRAQLTQALSQLQEQMQRNTPTVTQFVQRLIADNSSLDEDLKHQLQSLSTKD